MLNLDSNTKTANYNRTLAQELAGRGWHVFPCRPDKSPYTTHGMTDASTDLATVEKWWARWPGALVGIACRPSGIFAVDVDAHGEADGWEAWLDHAAEGGRPEGPTQRTPGGGAHFLFKLPAEIKIPGKITTGIDLRDNGYICTGALPDGREYQRFDWNLPVPDAPAWLLDWIKRGNNGRQQPAAQPAQPAEAGQYWLNKALALAAPGCRNESGLWLACQLRDAGLSQAEAEAVMADYAARVPGNGYTEREALASCNQAYQRPAREPAGPHPHKPTAQPEVQPAQGGLARWHTAAEALQPRPPVDWLLDGKIRAGSVVVLAGDPGGGKTWLVLNLALCIATGAAWLGIKTKCAPVLWVDAESGMTRMCDRVKAAIDGLQVGAAVPFWFVTPSDRLFDLRKGGDIDTLTAAVMETGAGLVVIDALVDVMPGGDENSVQDVGPLMLALRRLADQTGATVLLIHHNNKAGGYRGSTAIAGALDALLSLTPNGTPENGYRDVTVKTEKARDTEPWQIGARLTWSDGAFWSAALAPDNQPRLSNTQALVLNLLPEGNSAVTVTASDLAYGAPNGVSPNSIRRALYDLEKKGLVRRANDGGRGKKATYSRVKESCEVVKSCEKVVNFTTVEG